jgi:hypothetical protein
MFNDFNDLETFRASDKRTSSDFNETSVLMLTTYIIITLYNYMYNILKNNFNILFSFIKTKVSKSLKSLNILNSWYGSIESLMQYINIDVKKVKNMKIDLKSLIYSKLKQKYNCV